MKRLLPLAALVLLAACASGPRGPDYRGTRLKPVAAPSEVIAAEIAFAQLAQEKGQWAAFRATATDDAQMFVPQRVSAQAWLKAQAEPAVAVRWQPHQVWSSCDGSYAVTRGGWESPNAAGTFATVWQRQKKGDYKWVADMSLTTDGKVPAPEMISAKVAECKPAAVLPAAAAPQPGIDRQDGVSTDRTLRWSTAVGSDGSRTITVSLWNGQGFETVLDHHVPASRS
mgnify:CR=1 FL=1